MLRPEPAFSFIMEELSGLFHAAPHPLLLMQLLCRRPRVGYSPFALHLSKVMGWGPFLEGFQGRAPSCSTYGVQTQAYSICTWFPGCCSTHLDFQPCGSYGSRVQLPAFDVESSSSSALSQPLLQQKELVQLCPGCCHLA